MIFIAKLRKKIVDSQLKSAAFRDASFLVGGAIGAQTITVLTTPVLSRLYSPRDFGIFAVYLAISSVVAIVLTGRYEVAILKPKDSADALCLVQLSLLLTAGVSLILCVLSSIFPPCVWGFFGVPSLRILIFSILAAAGTAVLSTLQIWMNRNRHYAKMNYVRVSQSAIFPALSMVLFFLMEQKSGLIFGHLFSTIIIAISLFLLTKINFYISDLKRLGLIARTYKNSPIYLMPAASLDVISLQLPVVLISMWYSDEFAGQFNMAWRLLFLPLVVIGVAVGQVFLQRFAASEAKPEIFRGLLIKTWISLFLVGLPLAILVFLFGESIFIFVLGAEWGPAGRIASILAPMTLAMFVSSPTSGTYIILGMEKTSFILGLIAIVYRPMALFIGSYYGSIFVGLKIWVVFEVLMIIIYQALAWVRTGKAVRPL